MIEEVDGKTFFVDDETGARKEQKIQRFDLIPVEPLTKLAEHYGKGASKYEDRNWEKGYPWSKSYAALLRHLTAWWDGEDVDEESGSSHMTAVAWHAFALMFFEMHRKSQDDRPNSVPETSVRTLDIREVSEFNPFEAYDGSGSSGGCKTIFLDDRQEWEKIDVIR